MPNYFIGNPVKLAGLPTFLVGVLSFFIGNPVKLAGLPTFLVGEPSYFIGDPIRLAGLPSFYLGGAIFGGLYDGFITIFGEINLRNLHFFCGL